MEALSKIRPMPRKTSPAPPDADWREWLTEHGGKLLLFSRQQTRSAEDAEDALQQALAKLARKVGEGTFTGGQEAWLPYLYTQVRREAIDLGRKNDRRFQREQKVAADEHLSTPWFENDALGEDSQALLARALKEIPEKFAEVIHMKIWGDMTFAVISENLGISLNTAASRYRYGLEALRKKLEPARDQDDL